MSVEYRIISIGTLGSNLLWNEQGKLRTQHSTTTLVTENERRILVDPSLPAEILDARMFERTGSRLDSVTDVFCTTLHPSARRALPGLGGAAWWCAETELRDFDRHLDSLQDQAGRMNADETLDIEDEKNIVRRFKPAPDKFTPNINIFPLPGYSSGCAGLLLTPATHTVLIAGPAAPTREHIEGGVVWEHCADRDAAKESLVEILGIADVIVPGFDNVMLSPVTGSRSEWGM